MEQQARAVAAAEREAAADRASGRALIDPTFWPDGAGTGPPPPPPVVAGPGPGPTPVGDLLGAGGGDGG